ncbi:MAG: ATP-binding cassette domain-containing protein [Desulfobacterales bacterium]|jgi:putative thiamine transport system ATP-binding protein|nr:ATP-binding cassette domain-containing protein [Desulfobacterales bacterium]
MTDRGRPDAPRAGLELKRVRIALNGTELIPETSLTVRPGEVVTVMGPSGSGKSSLLAYLCGTLAREFQADGEVWIDGVEVTRFPVERRRIGILFQDDLLFPHMTVGENLLFAIPRSVKSRRQRRDRMRQALAEAGLAGTEARDPATLSGGQRARVALLRTLLARPHAVLLDEPFSSLDEELKASIRSFVFDHVRAQGLPTLMVTHAAEDAQAAGGPVMRVGRTPGG